MKRPSLKEIAVLGRLYRIAAATGNPVEFLRAHRRLARAMCLSLYPARFCDRRCP